MLGHLIRKEITDQLLSFRFMILAVGGALVIWLSIYSGYSHYRFSLRDYQIGRAATEDRMRQIQDAEQMSPGDPYIEITAISYYHHKPITPLSIFVRGLEMHMGRSFPQRTFNRRFKLSWAATEPILVVFQPLDLGLAVQVVFGLFALLLSYDALCGEKEARTLSLLASFPLPRSHLLLGKLIGTLIPVLAACGLPAILGVAVVLAMPEVSLSSQELLRLASLVPLFGIYLVLMVCVGVCASALTHRSVTSFVILLCFWTASVLLVPSLSLIVAEGLRPPPSPHHHQSQLALLNQKSQDRRFELVRKDTEEREAQFGERWWSIPDQMEARTAFEMDSWAIARESLRDEFDQLDRTFKNRTASRQRLALSLGRASPSFLLRNASIMLAGTGLDRQQRYRDALRDFIMGPEGDWFVAGKKRLMLQQRRRDKYGDPVYDVSDMPRLLYREAWPMREIREALIDSAVIALWAVVAFVISWIAVLKYDLR